MKLHIVVSDNKNLFNKLNTITNTIIKPEYKSIIYKKHSGLINGCNKCWLNAGIQMIGYMDDIVQHIINMDPSEDPIKKNIKKLFTDLLNGIGDSSGNINYGTTFDPKENHGYGNLYQYILQTLMKRYRSGNFEDTYEGLDGLFNYFFPYHPHNASEKKIIDNSLEINDYNMINKNITTTKCQYNTTTINHTIIQSHIYLINLPTTKISFIKLICVR
jgi:hypothetical protein